MGHILMFLLSAHTLLSSFLQGNTGKVVNKLTKNDHAGRCYGILLSSLSCFISIKHYVVTVIGEEALADKHAEYRIGRRQIKFQA